MNTAPTPASTPSTSSAGATGSGLAGQPTDAFALLFGSVQGAPMLVRSAPVQEQAPTDDPAAVGADLSGWLQQLPLSPISTHPDSGAGDAAAVPTVLVTTSLSDPTIAGASLTSVPNAGAPDLAAGIAQAPGLPSDTVERLASEVSVTLQRHSAATLPTGAALAGMLPGTAAGSAGDSARPAATTMAQPQPALPGLANAPQQAPPAALPDALPDAASRDVLPASLRPGEAVAAALLQRTELRGAPADPGAAASAAASPTAQALAVALPPGSAPRIDQAFAEGMAIRLQWMTQQQVGRVEIQLHPEDLGSIDVQIEFEGKSIRADFQSPVAEVRHLLESSLPRLRELLESHGLQLRHADVGSGQGHGQQGPPRQEGGAATTALRQGARDDQGGEPRSPPPRGTRHGGQLSEYA